MLAYTTETHRIPPGVETGLPRGKAGSRSAITLPQGWLCWKVGGEADLLCDSHYLRCQEGFIWPCFHL